uniref:EXON0/IE-0 n=1 Tax=Chrysodeixis includens nucleopolyhedrovirus TaxID=1207438 RepID=A0A1C8ZX77_9ABAC|nr:EXON0/IE-0 [Chrysodeixis includens nucleopolyhedrovirus]
MVRDLMAMDPLQKLISYDVAVSYHRAIVMNTFDYQNDLYKRIAMESAAVASILLSPRNSDDDDGNSNSLNTYLNIRNSSGKKARLISKQRYLKFIFNDLHTNDLSLNPKAQFLVKEAAFNVIDEIFQQTYNEKIDKILAFVDDTDDICMPTDTCLHYLIGEIGKIVNVLQHVKRMSKFEYSMYVFMPYLKRIRKIIILFVNDFCCKKLVKNYLISLDMMIENSAKLLETIQMINKRVDVMNVFLDRPVYRCNICDDTSLESRFLKPNECCGYSICNICYANLWKFCTLYPVCPVCKTSFKSSGSAASSLSSLSSTKHQQALYEE